MELFITCPENFENLLAAELKRIGVKGVRPGFSGVYAPQTLETVYHINYCSRLATRVLWPLAHFSCADKNALYQAASKIPWLDYFDETKTFAIDANVSHPNLRSSLYAIQVMKDAICDQIREKRNARPSIDIKNPDIQLNLFIHNQKGIISFDTSGAPLYKRGWRTLSSEASIQESLAAALLAYAGYTSETVLCDPFCGSGTFLIEAALMGTRTPPGYFRKQWGFLHLPKHNAAEWESCKQKADRERIPLSAGKIFGADQDKHTIRICHEHIKHVDLPIQVECSDIAHYHPPSSPSLVICNPPYGKRLETSAHIYQELGAFLRRTHPQKAIVLSPNEKLIKAIGLPIQSTFPFQHGGLPICAYHLKLRE